MKAKFIALCILFALLQSLSVSASQSAKFPVKGVVVAGKKITVTGITVQIKGTNRAKFTDKAGKY